MKFWMRAHRSVPMSQTLPLHGGCFFKTIESKLMFSTLRSLQVLAKFVVLPKDSCTALTSEFATKTFLPCVEQLDQGQVEEAGDKGPSQTRPKLVHPRDALNMSGSDWRTSPYRCYHFEKIDLGIMQCTPFRISTTCETRQSPTIEVSE